MQRYCKSQSVSDVSGTAMTGASSLYERTL